MSWLSDLPGFIIKFLGVEVATRRTLNFIGDYANVVDDPVNQCVNVIIETQPGSTDLPGLGDNDKVAVANNENLVYRYLKDENIDPAAGIAGSKIVSQFGSQPVESELLVQTPVLRVDDSNGSVNFDLDTNGYLRTAVSDSVFECDTSGEFDLATTAATEITSIHVPNDTHGLVSAAIFAAQNSDLSVYASYSITFAIRCNGSGVVAIQANNGDSTVLPSASQPAWFNPATWIEPDLATSNELILKVKPNASTAINGGFKISAVLRFA